MAGSEVSVSPVMGQGFRMERAPAAELPTCLLFATGSGISPIKALIESDELQVCALSTLCSSLSGYLNGNVPMLTSMPEVVLNQFRKLLQVQCSLHNAGISMLCHTVDAHV